MQELRDITPSPRILRTLGEIPFAPWQCIAELVDNSLDMFNHDSNTQEFSYEKRIIVSWSNENVAARDRQLDVIDTGPGMDLDTIQKSVKAGYTTNDPINNLGLFGMGFNISTARLGEKTLFLSARQDSPDWVGLEIDFANLTKSSRFDAPTVRIPKANKDEHGTRVVISRLRPGIFVELTKSANSIRKTLASIYAPILQRKDVEIMVQSKTLSAPQYCLWDAKRSLTVSKGRDQVNAVLRIDEEVGNALFDVERNRYLTPSEEDEAQNFIKDNLVYPDGIVERVKRVHGWLGIQRYPDPNDFGIDFVRNGRKILLKDKSLFSYQNSLTGTLELEYPVELGATVGGRIVGEINIDHVPPTYQKNDFDRTDPSWYEVVEVLRGSGPILPGKRRTMSLDIDNNSPIARLVRAYGECRAGTACLAAPNQIAREYANKFKKGDPEYLTDEKWWEAAREADREKADKNAKKYPEVDLGVQSSDDVSMYIASSKKSTAISSSTLPKISPSTNTNVSTLNTPLEDGSTQQLILEASPKLLATQPYKPIDPLDILKSRAKQIIAESREYSYLGCRAPLIVNTWEITSGKIGEGEEDNPCLLSKNGNQCDFFYNPRHPFLRDYPNTYKDLLLINLAERFKVRDNLHDISALFANLVTENFPDLRIDQASTQESANTLFARLRDRAPELLSVREQEVLDCVHESLGDVEEIVTALIYNTELLNKFQSRSVGGIAALSVAPAKTLVRLVDQFPEEFFDGKFFRMPYTAIHLSDPNSTERSRNEAKERIFSFLKDALWIISETRATPYRQRKAELARCAHSLSFLEQEIEN